MSDRPPERGVSPVSGRQTFLNHPRNKTIALSILGCAAVVLGGMGINTMIHDQGVLKSPDKTGSTSISDVTSAPRNSEAETASKPPPAVADKQKEADPPKTVANTAFVRMPSSAGETFFAVPNPTMEQSPTPGAAPLLGAPKERPPSTTTVAFRPSTIMGGKAGPAINMTYVLRPQLIPCALETAMDSEFAGAIMCHTTQDVLSQDHILLLPSGTQIMGTYKNDVHSGQSRLFAFAGTAITAEGIPVELDSDVADGLGMTGVPGDVNNHYFARFGAALLLNAGDMAVALGQSALSKNGSTNLNINSGGAGNLASEILQHQIDQPPTITVPPGTIINIVVTHPIDFRDALRVTTP
jgi:type IV secretion system protein VirB10